MTRNTQWIVGIIVVIVIVAVLWYAFGRQGADTMTPDATTGGTTETPAPAPAPEPAPAPAPAPAPTPTPQ